MTHTQFQGVGGGRDNRRSCRRGGGGYGPHVCEVWWAGVQWETQRRKKSEHHSKRERRGEDEKEKNEQKRKKSAQETKSKKNKFFPHLVALCLDPPAFPKGPWACPLEQRSVQIQAFHRAPDLLPIHIGSWSKVKCANMTKKRVLQRVLRYYGGSTRFWCANANIMV